MRAKEQIQQIHDELITLIRQAVEKENKIIGTFYQNKGTHFQDENESGEYGTSPIIVVQNSGFHTYGGYEAATLYELYIDTDGHLHCTLNGEGGEYFVEPIENVQVEGLLCITHWLHEHEFLNLTPPATYHCSECGSTNVKIQAWVDPNNNNSFINCDDEKGWCGYCVQHLKIIPHSELMVDIEYWWEHLDNGEDREVITGLITEDYDPANDYQAFDTACDEVWSAKTDEEKIAIWQQIRRVAAFENDL